MSNRSTLGSPRSKTRRLSSPKECYSEMRRSGTANEHYHESLRKHNYEANRPDTIGENYFHERGSGSPRERFLEVSRPGTSRERHSGSISSERINPRMEDRVRRSYSKEQDLDWDFSSRKEGSSCLPSSSKSSNKDLRLGHSRGEELSGHFSQRSQEASKDSYYFEHHQSSFSRDSKHEAKEDQRYVRLYSVEVFILYFQNIF